MPEEVLFETETALSREEIASYLRKIADKLEADGSISLSAGDRSIALDVPSRPTFEVKAERETPKGGGPGELSLEFELEWDEEGGDEDEGTLSIE